MERKFSVYDARSKFSEIIRWVMQQKTAVITYRGKPVVKLIPYEDEKPRTLESRLYMLQEANQLSVAEPTVDFLNNFHDKEVPGALQRFLEDRE